MERVQADEMSEHADSATADSEVVRVTFETWAREAVRDAFLDLAADEVERLCGRRHHPDRASPVERVGSAQGHILFGTEAMPVLRPRVPQRGRGAVWQANHLGAIGPIHGPILAGRQGRIPPRTSHQPDLGVS
jgi:hypothetical protein